MRSASLALVCLGALLAVSSVSAGWGPALTQCKMSGLRLSPDIGYSPTFWDNQPDYTVNWPADVPYATITAYPNANAYVAAGQYIEISVNLGHPYSNYTYGMESESFAVPAGQTTEIIFRIHWYGEDQGGPCESHYTMSLSRPSYSATSNGWYAGGFGTCSADCHGATADSAEGSASRSITCRGPSAEGPGPLLDDSACDASTRPSTTSKCYMMCSTNTFEGPSEVGSAPEAAPSPDPYGCAQQTDCWGCANTQTCGWCASTSTCATGTSSGPTNGACDPWVWAAAKCDNAPVTTTPATTESSTGSADGTTTTPTDGTTTTSPTDGSASGTTDPSTSTDGSTPASGADVSGSTSTAAPVTDGATGTTTDTDGSTTTSPADGTTTTTTPSGTTTITADSGAAGAKETSVLLAAALAVSAIAAMLM